MGGTCWASDAPLTGRSSDRPLPGSVQVGFDQAGAATRSPDRWPPLTHVRGARNSAYRPAGTANASPSDRCRTRIEGQTGCMNSARPLAAGALKLFLRALGRQLLLLLLLVRLL